MILDGDFIINGNTIIDAFVGNSAVTEIYLGNFLVWKKEKPSGLLSDETDNNFITEDDLQFICADGQSA